MFGGLFKQVADLFRRHEKHERLEKGPAGEWEGFLLKGEWVHLQSSNVDLAQYDYLASALFIQYKDGSVYGYQPVTFSQALSFVTASSHGKWVWDNLRIRGTKLGHRVAYRLDRFT